MNKGILPQTFYKGPHVIPLGETVQFRSTQVELSDGFNVESGALFEITIGPCGTYRVHGVAMSNEFTINFA